MSIDVVVLTGARRGYCTGARAVKANLDDAMTLPLGAHLDAETARFAECSGSAEAVATAKAFLGRS